MTANRIARFEGSPSRGTPPPSCPRHPGHRLGACALCAGLTPFPTERPMAHRATTTGASRARRIAAIAEAAERARAHQDAPQAPASQPGPAPSRFVKFRGRTLSFGDWHRETGLDKVTIANRITRGIPLDAPRDAPASRRLAGTWCYATDSALVREEPAPKPVVRRGAARERPITFRGETLTRRAWGARFGLNESTIGSRVTMGVPLDGPKPPKGVSGPRGTWDYVRDRAVEPVSAKAPKAGVHGHRPSPEIRFRGVTRTRVEWAVHLGISTVCVRERVLKGVPLDMPPHRGRTEIGPGRWDYARDVEIPRVVDVSKMQARRAKLEAELAVLREQIARAS